MLFSLHFFIGKTYMFEHRNLSKNLFRHVLLDFEKKLKIDHVERGIRWNPKETSQLRIVH